MAYSEKLKAGDVLPVIDVTLFDGTVTTLGKPTSNAAWQAVVVYRGKHCPLCTKYLNELEEHKQVFAEHGVEILAVSADSKEQLAEHLETLDISFPIAYGLTEAQMKQLGLYISVPRSEQETDHNFAEPGLFVINEKGQVQITDISNAPFARPDPATLARGFSFIRNPENNYPIRGTLDY